MTTAFKALCLSCGVESNISDDTAACPSCKDSRHVPANLDNMLNLRISPHELRILTIWADNWAREHESQEEPMRNVIRIILDRITAQTDIALTISQEIADISRMTGMGDVKIIDSDGNESQL